MDVGMSMTPPPSAGTPMPHDNSPHVGGGSMRTMTMPMHMAFFWGNSVQILFSGWPGDRGIGTYLLALLLVFTIAALVECLLLVSRRLSTAGGSSRASTGLLLTALHAARMTLAYLVMLAVMSFNVGVLIAAVAGHALGFLVAGSGLFMWARPDEAHGAGAQPNSHVMPSSKR